MRLSSLCSVSPAAFSRRYCYQRSDHPLGLFVYIALLDIGLLAIAHATVECAHRLWARWNCPDAICWVATFFVPEKYFDGNKVLVVMAVCRISGVVSAAALGQAHQESEP